jgi:hypothetical protein
MVLGSLLFLVAAFSPISNRVFPQRSMERRAQLIEGAPRQWLGAQVLFALGSLATAGGLLAHAFSGKRGRPEPAPLRAGATVFTASAALWTAAVVQRSLHPLRFGRGALSRWPSYASFLGAEAGLALTGLGLHPPEWPRWVGRTVTAASAALAALTLLFGDMPPFVFYLITMPLGVALQRSTRTTDPDPRSSVR